MKVKIKKLHPNAIIPKYAKPGDAGLDLTATSIIKNDTKQISFGTGIAMEIPKGYVGLVFPRSSIRNTVLSLSNAVGVVDSGYRGEIQATFNKKEMNIKSNYYNIGDRICQIIIMPYPQIEFEEVKELSITERGAGGHGSSGE